MLRKIFISCILLTGLLFLIRMCNPTSKDLDHILELRLGMPLRELRGLNTSSRIPMRLTSQNYIQLIKNTDAFEQELMREDRVKAFFLDFYVSPYNDVINDVELYFFDDQLYRVRIREFNPRIEEWLDKEEAIVLNERYTEPDKKNIQQILEEYAANWGEETTSSYIETKWNTNIYRISCSSSLGLHPGAIISSYELILVDKKLAGMARSGDVSEEETKQ